MADLRGPRVIRWRILGQIGPSCHEHPNARAPDLWFSPLPVGVDAPSGTVYYLYLRQPPEGPGEKGRAFLASYLSLKSEEREVSVRRPA